MLMIWYEAVLTNDGFQKHIVQDKQPQGGFFHEV